MTELASESLSLSPAWAADERRRGGRLSEPLRLVCFHHAGGGAAVFRQWRGSGVPLHAVRLPGREDRWHDPRHVELDPLVDQLLDELAEPLAGPHVLFGHSMGALIAYHIAQRRRAAGLRPPEALVVAAYAAPHLAKVSFQVDGLDDAGFGRALAEIGGLPEQLLHRPDWLGPILAVLRDDIRVCNSHHYRPTPPLPCPIHVYGGRRDPLVTEAELAGWREHTTSACTLTMVDGGHFLVQDPSVGLRDLVLASVRQQTPCRQ
jgi:surfactin synthase thioesterase subunit